MILNIFNQTSDARGVKEFLGSNFHDLIDSVLSSGDSKRCRMITLRLIRPLHKEKKRKTLEEYSRIKKDETIVHIKYIQVIP